MEGLSSNYVTLSCYSAWAAVQKDTWVGFVYKGNVFFINTNDVNNDNNDEREGEEWETLLEK